MLPGMTVPVDTDVQEIGKVVLEANTFAPSAGHARLRPRHFEVTAGTFGCLVRKKGKPELYILSNSHVLANSGTGKAGTSSSSPPCSTAGVQPADVLCQLSEWVPSSFGDDTFDNLVDAASPRSSPPTSPRRST